VQTFLTLDGVMQAPGGSEEDPSDAFAHGGWQAPFPDPAVGEFVTELTSHASAFLFGRRTFDIFRGYWPDQTDPANPIATAINSLPKYVVSGSLSQADATWRGEHPGTARLVTGDVAGAVQALKNEPGDELQIWGSSKLLQTLLQYPGSFEPSDVDTLAAEAFTAPAHRAIFDGVRGAGGPQRSLSAQAWADRVAQAAPLAVRGLVAELAVAELPTRFDKATGLPERRYIDALLVRVQEVALTRQIADAMSAMRRMATDPHTDPTQARALSSELQDLQRELARLRDKAS